MSATEQEIARLLGMSEEEWEEMKHALFEAKVPPEEAAIHVLSAARLRCKYKEGN